MHWKAWRETSSNILTVAASRLPWPGWSADQQTSHSMVRVRPKGCRESWGEEKFCLPDICLPLCLRPGGSCKDCLDQSFCLHIDSCTFRLLFIFRGLWTLKLGNGRKLLHLSTWLAFNCSTVACVRIEVSECNDRNWLLLKLERAERERAKRGEVGVS